MDKIVIACGAHGVKGAAVEYSDRLLRKEIKKVRKTLSKAQCQQLHKVLSHTLSDMLPTIAQYGMAIDAFGETYTKVTFDQDLVMLAVYDHVGNDSMIGLVKPTVFN